MQQVEEAAGDVDQVIAVASIRRSGVETLSECWHLSRRVKLRRSRHRYALTVRLSPRIQSF
jgi:hypothetical protein